MTLVRKESDTMVAGERDEVTLQNKLWVKSQEKLKVFYLNKN